MCRCVVNKGGTCDTAFESQAIEYVAFSFHDTVGNMDIIHADVEKAGEFSSAVSCCVLLEDAEYEFK